MKSVTPDDIRREHEAALAALTDVQRQSLWRQRHARQMMNFNAMTEQQNLQVLFEREAEARNAEDGEREAAGVPDQANDNLPRGPRPASAGGGSL